MSRILFWIATGVVTLLAGSFAISNRSDVTLALWPLPGVLDARLFVIVLGALVIGFAVGWCFCWVAYSGLRTAHRRRARELKTLKNDPRLVQKSDSRSLAA